MKGDMAIAQWHEYVALRQDGAEFLDLRSREEIETLELYRTLCTYH